MIQLSALTMLSETNEPPRAPGMPSSPMTSGFALALAKLAIVAAPVEPDIAPVEDAPGIIVALRQTAAADGNLLPVVAASPRALRLVEARPDQGEAAELSIDGSATSAPAPAAPITPALTIKVPIARADDLAQEPVEREPETETCPPSPEQDNRAPEILVPLLPPATAALTPPPPPVAPAVASSAIVTPHRVDMTLAAGATVVPLDHGATTQAKVSIATPQPSPPVQEAAVRRQLDEVVQPSTAPVPPQTAPVPPQRASVTAVEASKSSTAALPLPVAPARAAPSSAPPVRQDLTALAALPIGVSRPVFDSSPSAVDATFVRAAPSLPLAPVPAATVATSPPSADVPATPEQMPLPVSSGMVPGPIQQRAAATVAPAPLAARALPEPVIALGAVAPLPGVGAAPAPVPSAGPVAAAIETTPHRVTTPTIVATAERVVLRQPAETRVAPRPGLVVAPTASQPAVQAFAAAIFAAERPSPRALDVPGELAGAFPITALAAPPPLAVHALDASAAPVLDLRGSEWMGEMIETIEQMRDAAGPASAGATETRLRLAPDALGSVDVSIRQEGEQLQVRITADTAAARTILADAAPKLAEMAEARGLKLGSGGAEQGGTFAERQPRQQPSSHQPTRPASANRADDALASPALARIA